MKRRLILWASAPALVLAMAACGGGGGDADGGDDGQVTVESATEVLKDFGCTEVNAEEATDEAGVTYTVVSCQLSPEAAMAVNIVDAGVSVRDVACGSRGANSESAGLPIATGPNWVGVVFATDGTKLADLATALGGQTTTVAEYCA